MSTVSPYTTLLEKIQGLLPLTDPLAEQASARLCLSLSWVGHYLNSDAGSSAMLLRGAYGSALESVSLTALGLIKPAVLSLRSYFELCFQYIYLKDHPREMDSLLQYRWQAPLPGVVKKYLREHSPSYEPRIQRLDACKLRSVDDIYSVLSGVAHGNAINSISAGQQPSDLVADIETVKQCLPIFESTDEVISDHFLAQFSSNWMSVPAAVSQNIVGRMSGKNPITELNL